MVMTMLSHLFTFVFFPLLFFLHGRKEGEECFCEEEEREEAEKDDDKSDQRALRQSVLVAGSPSTSPCSSLTHCHATLSVWSLWKRVLGIAVAVEAMTTVVAATVIKVKK